MTTQEAKPQPLYNAHGVDPAYQLRYSWCGWFSSTYEPPDGWDVVLKEIAPLWEKDGLRLLEPTWSENSIKLCFSATPQVSPVVIATRSKGRLEYALRQSGQPCKFSRKVSLRSVGDNTTQQVEQYIRSQVDKEGFVDPEYEEFLRHFTEIDPSVDLSSPTATRSGRYWYNLHTVLVVRDRDRIADAKCLAKLRDTSFDVAKNKNYQLAALSVMPDHLHIALRGHIEHAPEEIVLGFQNNTAWRLGRNAIWKDSYYAGTFSDYDMNAIRNRSKWYSSSNGGRPSR